MDRSDLDELLQFTDEIEQDVQNIKNALYSSDDEVEDLALSSIFELEGVTTNFANAVRYLDHEVLMEEAERSLDEEVKRGLD